MGSPRAGSLGWWPVTASKARRRVPGAVPPHARQPSPAAAAHHRSDRRITGKLAGKGLDNGPHTIAWHLEHHHGLVVSAATIHRHLREAGLTTPHRRSGPSRPTSGSPPNNPTDAGRPISPTGGWPTAPTSRSSTGSTTTPATRLHRAPPRHWPHRARCLPQCLCRSRHPSRARKSTPPRVTVDVAR
jgi:hypothetical protein